MLSMSLFLLGLIVSAVVVYYSIQASHRFGVVDQPGGHKAHDTVTPFVGGVGILAAMLTGGYVVSQYFPSFGDRIYVLLGGVLVLFITGFADDILQLNYKIRFGIQAAVGLAMVFLGGSRFPISGSCSRVISSPWVISLFRSPCWPPSVPSTPST